MDGDLSNTISLNAGVPHGSVLDPILFSLYLSDFYTSLRYCKYNFYADDLIIYIH